MRVRPHALIPFLLALFLRAWWTLPQLVAYKVLQRVPLLRAVAAAGR